MDSTRWINWLDVETLKSYVEWTKSCDVHRKARVRIPQMWEVCDVMTEKLKNEDLLKEGIDEAEVLLDMKMGLLELQERLGLVLEDDKAPVSVKVVTL